MQPENLEFCNLLFQAWNLLKKYEKKNLEF